MAEKIIALSGGKDSTALALALQEYEPGDYKIIANPTGNELPEMDRHLESLEGVLGQHIHRVGCGLTFEELIYEQQMIPNFWARFCTRILKIEPTQEFLRQFENPVLHVGLRADEESRGGADYGVQCRFPFREWGWNLSDVWAYLRRRNVTIPRRTDCAWCFYQRIDEWWSLWRHYPRMWRRGESIERDIGHTFRKPDQDTWPAAMEELAQCFRRGHVPRRAPNRPRLLDCAVCGS